jgi:hypothetical protein
MEIMTGVYDRMTVYIKNRINFLKLLLIKKFSIGNLRNNT